MPKMIIFRLPYLSVISPATGENSSWVIPEAAISNPSVLPDAPNSSINVGMSGIIKPIPSITMNTFSMRIYNLAIFFIRGYLP